MDKAAAIAQIRKELTEGDIEAALQLLIDHLEPERSSRRNLYNRAIQAKAQLEKTQRDELQGVISFENSKLSYNQITQQVLNLIDEWENPETAPKANATTPQRRIKPKTIVVAVVSLVFLGIIVWQALRPANDPTVVYADDICPNFESNTFSIMVLPYYSLRDPASNDSPHRPLATRLDRFKGEFSGKYTMRVFSKEKPITNIDSEAIQAAEACKAKLAIWGEYEHLSPETAGTIVTTNYKYLSASENFQFTMLNLDENSEISPEKESSHIPTNGFFVDTIKTYSEIINNGTISDELEDQFRLLFGVAVMQNDQPEEALTYLKELHPNDSTASLLQGMALAESQLQNGDKEAAVQSYDQVLKEHPDYWFAINNRAMLYYQKGDYTETLETLDRKLQKDPENINALTVRGAVRLKTLQLEEAERDLLKADSLSKEESTPEQKRYIRKNIDQLDRKKGDENRRIADANNLLAKNRNSLEALTDLAEANRNLGNYEQATVFADRILDREADNPRAMAVKLESAAKTRNEREVNLVRKEVLQLDAKQQRIILQERPILKGILETRTQ